MKALRILAILSFVAGVAMLVVGFASNGGDSNAPADEAPVSIVATPTPVPTQDATASATVPPTPTPLPEDGDVARLRIPKLSVDSLIENIGLLPSNQLDTPHDPLNTGWYDIYDKPGRPNPGNSGWQDFGVYDGTLSFRGNTVFSAHVDYFPNIRGPFYNLTKLTLGDEIVVVMENGVEYRYQVIRRERYPEATIPMGDLIWPKIKPADKEWVTLITCGGRFVQTERNGAGKYLDRDVVVAERID